MRKKLLASVLMLSLVFASLAGCGANVNEGNADTDKEKEEIMETSEALADSTAEEVLDNQEEKETELSFADELEKELLEKGIQFTIGDKVYELGYDKTSVDEMIEDGYIDSSVLDEDNFKNIINNNNGNVPVVNESGENIATVVIDIDHNIRSIKDWSEDVTIGILSDITMNEWDENFTFDYDDGEMRYIVLGDYGEIMVNFTKNSEGSWQMSSVNVSM